MGKWSNLTIWNHQPVEIYSNWSATWFSWPIDPVEIAPFYQTKRGPWLASPKKPDGSEIWLSGQVEGMVGWLVVTWNPVTYQVENISQVVAWPFEISEPSKVYVLVKVDGVKVEKIFGEVGHIKFLVMFFLCNFLGTGMSMESKRKPDDLKEQHLFLKTHFSFSFFVHGFFTHWAAKCLQLWMVEFGSYPPKLWTKSVRICLRVTK